MTVLGAVPGFGATNSFPGTGSGREVPMAGKWWKAVLGSAAMGSGILRVAVLGGATMAGGICRVASG